MSFKVCVYDPTSNGYAARISHEQWERHRAYISDLHAAKTPRKVMLRRLREEFDFKPTLGQLQAKCKDWNLKVYAKEGSNPKSPESDGNRQSQQPISSARDYHLVTETGYAAAWSDDYRVHPMINLGGQGDTQLPAFGLLANTVDSHWPLPEDDDACFAMQQSAQYYLSVNAFQQAFSIYRAVYLYQRRTLSICDTRLIRTVLFSACAAATDHQRNIVHSVLCEIGSSSEFDTIDKLYIECMQSASLSMMSASSCDLENAEQARARATAYLTILNCSSLQLPMLCLEADVQAMLYQFEHNLLMQEHQTKILQHLLIWCESTLDRLHREIDDIFVGHSNSEEEYHHRVAQVLSGYMVSQWCRRTDDQDESQSHLMHLSQSEHPLALHFSSTTIQTLVALAFIIVDAVRCDPLFPRTSADNDTSTRMWFLDAAKLFKRGIRMLNRLDERSRCAIFTEAYLERFYTSVSYRHKAFHWDPQLPAIVDSVGMSFAQQNTTMTNFDEVPDPILQIAEDHIPEIPMDVEPTDTILNLPSDMSGVVLAEPMDVPFALVPDEVILPSSPTSDWNSIASFVNTYQRACKTRLNPDHKSGRSTPGDVISLTSSTDFKMGNMTFATCSDVESIWFVMSNHDSSQTQTGH